MRNLILSLVVIGAQAAPLSAKPLLMSSEDTHQSVCLAYEDTPARLVEICTLALDAEGTTDRQKLELKDSLAWAHYDLENLEEARRLFQEVLDEEPAHASALNGMGWAAFLVDDFVTATRWFEKALAAAPEAQSLAGLGGSLFRSGEIAIEEAVGYLDAAIAIKPDYSWAMREKAWSYVEVANYDGARAAFQEALDVYPDDENANYGIAYILTERSEWEEALPYVNRVLQLNPDSRLALSRRSLILLNLDRPTQALKDGERVVALLPENSDGYVRVARAQKALGRMADAMVTLSVAHDIVGYETYLSYWRAHLLFDDSQYDNALEVLDEIFEHDDAGYYEHELKSQILLTVSRYEDARAAVDVALAAYPQEPWLIYYDALTQVGEGAYAAAEARFDAAIKAGLPREELTYFLEQLVGAAQYVQAIKLRVRYRDQES